MTITKYTARITNDNVDPNNFQLVGFTFDNTENDPVNTSLVLAYLAEASNTYASGTRIIGVSARTAGSAGGVDVPFPVTEYAANASGGAADGHPLPAMAAYGVSIGGGGLTPLGTSISVSERTSTVGPTGRGRHFLPFTSTTQITAGGRLAPSTITEISDKWRYWFGYGPSSPYVLVGPVITNRLLAIPKVILTVKAQPVLSNLESRRR